MCKRRFLRATLIVILGVFLASCGPSEVRKGERPSELIRGEPPTETPSPQTGSKPVSPAPTAKPATPESTSVSPTAEAITPERTTASQPVESVDWYNTQYTVACPSIAPQPFTLDVSDGEGHAPPSGENKQGYDVRVVSVATGGLSGNGRPEVAVLLSCGPTATNFGITEVQVFTDGPQLLARLRPPALRSSTYSFPPQITADPFLIHSGQLDTGGVYWSRSDPHCCPSINLTLTWQWDGSQFTAEPVGTPGTTDSAARDQYQAEGSQPQPEQQTSPVAREATLVEAAIRDHYEAIGAGNFEEAYSYFGPTFRSRQDQASWVEAEQSYQIEDSTIHSVEVNELFETTATATVEVSFVDNTGTPRFVIVWDLVKEGGQWKLDEQISAESIS